MQGAKYCAEACQAGCALAEECIQPGPTLRASVARVWEVIVLAANEVDGFSSSPIDLRFCADLLSGSGSEGGRLLDQVALCKITASEIREIAHAMRELEESRHEAASRHRR